MITYDYDYIYQNLKIRGYTLEFLRCEKILSQSTIQRLRHNDPISTSTIDTLCTLLDCQPQDFNSLEKNVYGRIFTSGTTSADDTQWKKTKDLRGRE